MPFGVSNSFKRGTVKTYSRHKAQSENTPYADRPHKRVCMDPRGIVVEHHFNQHLLQLDEPSQEKDSGKSGQAKANAEDTTSSLTASSSPQPHDVAAVSSDALSDESELSSPPSSPPEPQPSPRAGVRRPTFSFLKRKRSLQACDSKTRPLSETSSNIQKPNCARQKKPLTQMQIDLGKEVRKTCRSCGMEYISSNAEDLELHKEFCGINANGIEVGKSFLQDSTLRRVMCKRTGKDDRIEVVVVDRRSSPAAQRKLSKILEVVNVELSAAVISDEILWGLQNSSNHDPNSLGKRNGRPDRPSKAGDSFKAFVHLIGERCVSVCLAEKVNRAFPVVDVQRQARREDTASYEPSTGSSLSVSTSADIALLGVSRIWVSKAYRRQGLAFAMLESARNNFFYGLQVPKNLMAFSQPTESGGRLAKRWFEAETGWHIYDGDPQAARGNQV